MLKISTELRKFRLNCQLLCSAPVISSCVPPSAEVTHKTVLTLLFLLEKYQRSASGILLLEVVDIYIAISKINVEKL